MELNICDIVVSEKDGTVTVSGAGDAVATNVKHIWFDCNCPHCRRHFLDNLDEDLDRIRAGEMVLEMTPVAFLTQYSADIGALLLTVAPYGAEVYFGVVEAAIFNGLSEQLGNDADLVESKIQEIYKDVVVPALRGKDVTPEVFAEAAKRSYAMVKENTQNTAEQGINGVPFIENRTVESA